MKRITGYKLTIVTLLTISAGALAAGDKNPADELSRISTFSIGRNGFIGGISKGESLYNEVLRHGNREMIFKRLLESEDSTPEAKLYALCGLVKGKANKSYLLKFQCAEKNVSILKGDILSTVPFQEIYGNIVSYGC